MPQPKKGTRLGSSPAHQKLMLANLAVSLFDKEKINTTEAKAKMLRPFAEKLITKAKKGDLHNRRQVLSVIEDRDIVHKLFDDIGPRFADRNGGYTRILKIGPRHGDNAPMVLIELVDEGAIPVATTVETPEGKKRRLTRPGSRRKAAATPEGTEAEAGDDLELEDEAAPEAEADVEETVAEAEDSDVDAEAEAEVAEEAAAETDAEVVEPEAEPEASATDEDAETDKP